MINNPAAAPEAWRSIEIMNTRNCCRVGAFAAGVVGLSLSIGSAAQELPPRGPAPFSAYDQNGDGAVSEAEFNTFRAQRQADGRPMRMAPSFKSLDSNRDGRLSSEEFAAGQRPAGGGQRSGPMPGRAGMPRGDMPAFADFDRDANGMLTEQEFNDARAARIKERAEEGRMMRGMASAKAFGDLDTNRDGSVSPDEFAAHQAAQRQKTGR